MKNYLQAMMFILSTLICVICYGSDNDRPNGMPLITISPENIDGGGYVEFEIFIDYYPGNFDYCYLELYEPDGEEESTYYIDAFDLEDNRYTFYKEISKYDMSGYWYINSLAVYYTNESFTFNAETINKGFEVINTFADTVPPEVSNFIISKDTAYPGDTVLISYELKDTLSGLASNIISIRDSVNNVFFSYEEPISHDSVNLTYEYIVKKYEMPGLRYINIDATDRAENYLELNHDSLGVNLIVLGTTPDLDPPLLKKAEITVDSESNDIILNLIITDSSGLRYINVDLYNEYYTQYLNLYEFDLEQVNDSLYIFNISNVYPYISSGEYYIDISFTDFAGNYDYVEYENPLIIENLNSDSGKPEIISIEFNKDTLIADEKITLTIVVSDDVSGIYNIMGEIRHTDSYRNERSFWEEVQEEKVTLYTYSRSFKLSDFGPAGTWIIDNFQVIDHNDLNAETQFDLPEFYYIPKYIDDIAPVYDSIVFEPKMVNAGDTVIATIYASDDLSGIYGIDYEDDLGVEWVGKEIDWYDTENNTYQAKFPINKYTSATNVDYTLYSIKDKAGNYNNISEEGLAFTIINDGEVDVTPPVLDSMYISKKVLNPEDTLELIFYMSDDLSGIDPKLVYALFDFTNSSLDDDYDEWFETAIIPDQIDLNTFTKIIPAHRLSPGVYNLYILFALDSAGNPNEYEHDYEVDYSEYSFEVLGDNEYDLTPPVLVDIDISPKKVKPGETVNIKIKATDYYTGIITIFGYIANQNGVEYEELLFSDWEMTEVNDTFILEHDYIVPEYASNGIWVLEDLEIYDYNINETYLTYGIGYDNAEFEVTGGLELPNRPPTWVLNDIYLQVDAGNTLSYNIPDYIIADIDGDDLSYSITPSPSWISLSETGLNLAANPENNDAGEYTIYVIASDPEGLKDTLNVYLTVNSENFDNIDKSTVTEMKVYPNPTVDYINIELSNDILENVSIYNMAGKEVYRISANLNRINLTSLNSGVYIIKAVSKKSTYIYKISIK